MGGGSSHGMRGATEPANMKLRPLWMQHSTEYLAVIEPVFMKSMVAAMSLTTSFPST